MHRLTSLFTLLGILMVGLASNAAAHITANPREATAGSWFRTALRVSHGCEGAATVAVQVTLPEGVISARPQVKPGWTIETKMRPIEPPVAGPHGMITETLDQVIWRGGPLPNAYFDEFGLSMRLPDEPGKTLYFPTIQECEDGTSRWTEIPEPGEAWGDRKYPAPFVRIKAAPPTHEHKHDHSKHSHH